LMWVYILAQRFSHELGSSTGKPVCRDKENETLDSYFSYCPF
jgi:hypothetical protein